MINICFVYRRSVGEHFILVMFEIGIKQNCSVQTAYYHHLFKRMDVRLSDTFGMSTTHVDCKHQLRVPVYVARSPQVSVHQTESRQFTDKTTHRQGF